PVVAARLIGVTSKIVGSPWTGSNSAPSSLRASTMRSVSRETNTPVKREGAVDRAARMRCRLVNDFEPGSATVADTGRVVNGADQSSPGGGVIVANSTSFISCSTLQIHLPRYPVIAASVVDGPVLKGIISTDFWLYVLTNVVSCIARVGDWHCADYECADRNLSCESFEIRLGRDEDRKSTRLNSSHV